MEGSWGGKLASFGGVEEGSILWGFVGYSAAGSTSDISNFLRLI